MIHNTRSQPEVGTSTLPAISIQGVGKHYGATHALDDVSFQVGAGEVRGLLGENGAGKSTLLKILSGFVRRDAGQITISGDRYDPARPADAHAAGIQTAFQELTLVDDLSVAKNLLMPREPKTRLGLLDRRAIRREAEALLDRYDLAHIDPLKQIRELSLADRQKIEIVRAASRTPRILLLDEATSALTGSDVEWLFDLVRASSREGATVVFISHRLPEIREICQSITILRNGRYIETGPTDSYDDNEIVRLVIGRSLSTAFPPKPDRSGSDKPVEALSVRNLSVGSKLSNVSFELRQGEILGVAGLDGMGQRELFAALFGAAPADTGTVSVHSSTAVLTDPSDAIAVGIGYVPSDRRREGVLLPLTGTLNLALPVLSHYATGSWIHRDRLTTDAMNVMERMSIPDRAEYLPAGSFSGGNQQKLVIAKWILARKPILLMFDPTRGVDVGTKHEIYAIMRDFVANGGAILFHSTELPELINLCDRILVIYRGRVTATFDEEHIPEEDLMHSVLGGTEAPVSEGSHQQ